MEDFKSLLLFLDELAQHNHPAITRQRGEGDPYKIDRGARRKSGYQNLVLWAWGEFKKQNWFMWLQKAKVGCEGFGGNGNAYSNLGTPLPPKSTMAPKRKTK